MNNPAKRFARHLFHSRVALVMMLMPLAATTGMSDVMGMANSALKFIYIVLGFSLIIFLHELGHFVVARLCSVKCLAFSIGIGPRMLGWRKHGGLTFGSDPWDPEALQKKHANTDAAAVQSDLPTTAHEPPHPGTVGDCDYRLSWLPLGGYVRMLGQDDMDPTKQSADPHSFGRRPIWQRMCIVSAGVIMNVIFAVVCFSIIFSPGIGVEFPPAKIGIVQYDSPAWQAGIRPGDEVVSINGKTYRGFLEFTDIQMECALSNGTDPLVFLVKHPDGKTEPYTIMPKRSEETGFLAIGVAAMPGTKLMKFEKDEFTPDITRKMAMMQVNFEKNLPEYQKLIGEQYQIAKVGETELADPKHEYNGYLTLANQINAGHGEPVVLTVEQVNHPKETRTLTLVPHIEQMPGVKEWPAIFGLVPQVVIVQVFPGKPGAQAKPGMQEGDRILAIGDRTAPDEDEFRRIIKESAGNPLSIKVERAAAAPATAPASSSSAPASAAAPDRPKVETLTVTPVKPRNGDYMIGVALVPDITSARVVPWSKVAGPVLDLPADARIVSLDGKPVSNWQDIYGFVRTKKANDTVQVVFAGSGQTVTRTLTLSEAEVKAVNEQLHYMLGLSLENVTRNQHGSNTIEAIELGLDHTKKFILNVYMTLAGLARRTVDPSNLHGIVGITKIGYEVQDRGTVWLWYVLAMVSVNLAVANFLPLPIVDGGLFLLLILEKIRGRPLSLKVQTAIQAVGIVLLAGLFIFVTVNDIGMFKK